jgi:hypothetical protein
MRSSLTTLALVLAALALGCGGDKPTQVPSSQFDLDAGAFVSPLDDSVDRAASSTTIFRSNSPTPTAIWSAFGARS